MKPLEPKNRDRITTKRKGENEGDKKPNQKKEEKTIKHEAKKRKGHHGYNLENIKDEQKRFDGQDWRWLGDAK
jgi:hypothetical protein